MREVERVRLFSNGEEFRSWSHYNCDHCTKQRPCELEEAIAVAYLGDGRAQRRVAERLGLLTDEYDVRCSERQPTPALAAYDARVATYPKWRIERGDGFVPVDGKRWSTKDARAAIANWNRHPSYEPKYQYRITRITEAPDAPR